MSAKAEKTAPQSLGRLLAVPDAARYLDMTEAQLRRHLRARRVRYLRAGRKVQIYTLWLDEFRAAFTVEPGTGIHRAARDEERLPARLVARTRDLLPARRQIRVG